MEGISKDVSPSARRRNVVSETANGGRVALHVVLLPFSEEGDEEVALEFAMENLREEVQVRDEGGLQDNGDVRSVEQLDRVRSLVATHSAGGDSQFNAEALYELS